MYQADMFTKPTKAKMVERMLKDAGISGVTNGQLNRVTFRYGAVIHRLRKEGWLIDTIPIDRKNGYYRYIYKGRLG